MPLRMQGTELDVIGRQLRVRFDGKELMLEDEQARVLQLCDGNSAFEEGVEGTLEELAELGPDVLWTGLKQLEEARLIPPQPTRRQVVAALGATVLPAVISVLTATPAAAASCISTCPSGVSLCPDCNGLDGVHCGSGDCSHCVVFRQAVGSSCSTDTNFGNFLCFDFAATADARIQADCSAARAAALAAPTGGWNIFFCDGSLLFQGSSNVYGCYQNCT